MTFGHEDSFGGERPNTSHSSSGQVQGLAALRERWQKRPPENLSVSDANGFTVAMAVRTIRPAHLTA
jgi:hypothetical protein